MIVVGLAMIAVGTQMVRLRCNLDLAGTPASLEVTLYLLNFAKLRRPIFFSNSKVVVHLCRRSY